MPKSKYDTVVPSKLLSQAAIEVLQVPGLALQFPCPDALGALDLNVECSYRGTISVNNSNEFVLRVLAESAPTNQANSYEIISCALHNQLGMSFITVVSEFAALLPWAQRLLEHPASLVEDYSDMEKALDRVRNSYNDYRDQCRNLGVIITTEPTEPMTATTAIAKVKQLLDDNEVYPTTVEHPGCMSALASGVTFGLFTVRAFEKFNSYFLNNMLAVKTHDRSLTSTEGKAQ